MSIDQPELLYHTLQAPLYPTNDPSSKLLAIRFASPVRVSRLRITPEGVASPTGPGQTYPPAWTGKCFFNVSPSTPVNAMVEMEIDVTHSQHPLDFTIDMPPGVTTRLVSLLTPAETLTVSLYGYGPIPLDPGPSTHPADLAHAEEIKEDWTWVSDWAGGVRGLVEIVGNPSTYSEVRDRAVSCLELLQATAPSGILQELLDEPAALGRLFDGYPSSTICRTLRESNDHVMHLNLKPFIPPDHPLYTLIHAPPEDKRKAAWETIPHGRPALAILARTTSDGTDLLEMSDGHTSSNLSRLLEVAELWADEEGEESGKCLELALDILQSAPPQPLVLQQLAWRLPRLVLLSRLRGSSRTIALPNALGADIARALLPCATEVIDRRSAWPTAIELVQPYLESLEPSSPLHRAFTNSTTVPALSPFPDTVDGRALSRLESALSASLVPQQRPSSVVHAITNADLLSIIAPTLRRTLASAPIPLLDIPSSIPDYTPDSQASAWAGKVYSEHEFRTRENVGLGIPGMSGQGTRASRPASRHVDEYAR